MADKLSVIKQTPAQRMMSIQMDSLKPTDLDNLNTITSRYPGISNDLALSMTRAGLTADTPGIDKIATVDGIAALKNDAFNVDKIKSTVKPNRGILGSVQNAFGNYVYDPFKGATRLVFATLRSPYDAGTTFIRNAVAVGRGEEGAKQQFMDDLNPITGGLFGESTLLGQTIRNANRGTGSGFFITPETKIGKEQARRMAQYGKVNGKSYTIGRGLFNGIGMNPNSNAYNIMSGILDATLNLAADPSTYLGPGAVTKIVGQGKKVAEFSNELADLTKAGYAKMAEEDIAERLAKNDIVRDKITKKISSQYKRGANKFKSKEQEAIAVEQKLVQQQAATVSKILNTEKKAFALDAADDTVKSTLSPNAIAEWFVSNPKTQTGELTEALDLLSADMKNTGSFFDGFIVLDEVPQYGKISVGAHGLDEYAVTANEAKGFNLLDLADDFTNADDATRTAESLRRSQLADALDKLGKNASDPDFKIYNELATNLRDGIANLDGFVGSLFAVGDELVAAKTLGSLIGDIAQYKNPFVMAKIADAVQNIWKVDGFSNIRSIYGKEGGVVITKSEKLAATRAEIGNAAAEFTDPTNLGPNVMKLLDSVQDTKASLAAREQELNDIVNSQLDLTDKENWFKLVREKAHGDPEILRELIQDPNNYGIKNLLKLELEIADNNVLIESLRSQIGIVDNFMGSVGEDFSKPLKFLLGRQFQPVGELIAKETDPVKLRRLFGRKLDDRMVMELTAATTADDVFKVFLNQFVPGGDPLKIKESISTGVKIATSPMARMVPGVNLRAVKYAEDINKALGRFYIRSTALNLNDVTAVNNGFEDWVSSIGLAPALRDRGGKIIAKSVQEEIIADTQRAIFKATTNAERGAAVANGVSKLMNAVSDTLSLDPAAREILQSKAKINGARESIIDSYSLNNVLGNKGAGLIVSGGESVRLEKGILESQLVHDVLNLPDTRALNKVIVDYKTNIPLYGTAKSLKVLAEEAGDLWRTAQLVGRISYIARNVAEMQMRQFFSGHISLFNNPIGFISMVMANPEGKFGFQKALAKRSKYGTNVLGQYWKSTDAEIELSDSLIARRGAMRQESVGDYGKAGRNATIFRAYEDVTSEHPEFLQGLAWTTNNFSSDKFMPDVIRVMQQGTPQAQNAYVDNLIKTFDEPGNKLREFAAAIFDSNEGMRQILLKNPYKETGPGIVADNMNKENILIWLFDVKQPDSVAGQLNLVAGQGSKRNQILDLIRDGELKVPTSGGKVITIKAPYRQKGLTTEQVIEAEKAYTRQIAKFFKPEELQGSVVKNMTEKAVHEGNTKVAKQFVDWFFDKATIVENKLNFGPEFDAAYWDFAVGYADMLDTASLKELLKNANKALAPTSKGGRNIIGRVPKQLRVLNNTVKKREANPDYVHKGGASLRTIDSMAAEQAANYVKELFYDAGKQKQWANAFRLVAPFAQAHYNTLAKWSELTRSNPVPIYRAGKAFDALTKEGSNVIYDVTGMTYDDNQGFLYKDEGSEQLKFKMPIAGTLLGGLAGMNMNAKDALQITSPVQSLNLAFGSVNPLVPGFGPAMVAAYQMSGRSAAFGPVDSILQDILTPFGQPKTVGDIIFPAWFKKTSAAFLGNDATTQRAVKDWASYLASTGSYGDNPLATDAERTRLFNDAEKLARNMNLIGGLFQSISPATPIQEVLASVKNPKNKQNFMTMTTLYKAWNDINQNHPGDRNAAVTEFADKFGIENLLIAVSETTPGTSGSGDAWSFLNNNPSIVDKYATPNGDIVPYFFPGGEFSLKYYNWQKKVGSRRQLSTDEIAQESEGMVYSMLKSQLAEKQIAGRYTDFWYNEQLALLDKQFTARPGDVIVTGVNDQKVANIGLALQEPAFQKSLVYKQAAEFYAKFESFKKTLNDYKVTNYAELSSKGGVPTLMRDELIVLGEKLMTENPEFSRMYYGVFAGLLRESK